MCDELINDYEGVSEVHKIDEHDEHKHQRNKNCWCEPELKIVYNIWHDRCELWIHKRLH